MIQVFYQEIEVGSHLVQGELGREERSFIGVNAVFRLVLA